MDDKTATRKHFNKVSESYETTAILQSEIATRLSERLDFIKIKPESVLDAGCATGFITKDLLKRYPKSDVFAYDLAYNMTQNSRKVGGWLRKPYVICCDAESSSIKADSLDLIVSNLMLSWCTDLNKVFTGFHASLAPNGLLLFSIFGPDTLQELRQCLELTNSSIHLRDFVDMHDIGDALLQAGFIDPVTDMEVITMTYSNVSQIMKDVDNIGIAVDHEIIDSELLEASYQQYKTSDNLYPASWEIIYGHAWLGEGVKLDNYETVIPIYPAS